MSTPPALPEEKPRPNRMTMQGAVWNANHILHLALKHETSSIPKHYFEDSEAILLLNVVKVGLLVGASYGTGVLLAKDNNGKWSLPCAMGLKSVGVGSLAMAVCDLIIFILDRSSLENLMSANSTSLQMETPVHATLGPLGRYNMYTPSVTCEAIENYAAFSFTKGAFAGITGDYASMYPLNEANEAFYKKKGVTPQEILLENGVKVPKKMDTLLPDVYQKLDMLSKGAKYADGKVKKKAEPAEHALPSTAKRPSTTSTKSTQSNCGNPAKPLSNEKRPSVTQKASPTPKQQKPRPSVTKKPITEATNKPVTRPSVTKKANTPPTQKSRPSVTNGGKASTARRPSIEIPEYNC